MNLIKNLNVMEKIKKALVIRALKMFVKYVLPVLLGWLEGDSHTIEQLVKQLLDLL